MDRSNDDAIVSSDRQLMMLLNVVVEMEERWRVETGHDGLPDNDCRGGLYEPELVQAYKVVIEGMQSLQNVNNDQALSGRLRERTQGLLRCFGPDHKLSIDQCLQRESNGLDEGPSPSSESTTNSLLSSSISDAAFQQQSRLGEDHVRKLMTAKDTALVELMEEHEVEMDVMASEMEMLHEKERVSRHTLRKTRKFARCLLLVALGSISMAAIYREHKRRAWVQRQIAMGRDEERRRNSAKEIERLTFQRDQLQREFDTAKGTARYQHSRLFQLEVATNQTLDQISSIQQKWWFEQAEMERCRTAITDVQTQIASVNDSIQEFQEEQRWCTNRLQGRDAELNSLRFAKTEHDVKGLVPAGAISASEQATLDSPVKLEMKYNQSVRHAMILRQVYSGLGGVAASIVLRMVFPQAFSCLSLPAATVTTPAAKKAVVAAPKKFPISIKWVDRIHAATVILLVVRTAVFFFLP